MRKIAGTVPAALFLLFAAVSPIFAAPKGEYLEARSADVYTGPCFANSEESLAGKEAILAWKIEEGDWKGIPLDSLSVVAVVRARATLGDPYHSPLPAQAVLILDARGNTEQRAALADFARSRAGSLLARVVRVEIAPIQFSREGGEHDGAARVVAGNLAQISTRSLCHGDHFCGNEIVYYPPLVNLSHAMPAFTLESSFSGQGLGEVWQNVGKRSAFVGRF